MSLNKASFVSILIWCLLLSIFYPLRAQESSDSKLRWSGYLQTDNRMRLTGDKNFSWKEYRLDLKAEIEPSFKTKGFFEVWVRSLGFSQVQNSSDLADKNKISPYNLELREAYVDLFGFLFDNLDIRIGRQRIAWGTGDKLNPTDNLNPYDLEDIWDFGRHLGSDGFKLSYYLGNTTFEVVYIPIFTPAVMPKGDWASALSPSLELPAGLSLRNLSDTIIMPRSNVKNSSTFGFKVLKNFFDFDFSLSYVYGRYNLPLARKLTLTPTGLLGEIDIASELVYPKQQVIGADTAGAVGDIGIWAEFSIFFPEKTLINTDLSALGMGIQESIALDDQHYVKYVAGADYTFKNGMYLNIQYLHGFIHERGKDNLEDYFMLGIEKKFFEDKLNAKIFGGMEVKKFKDFENNYALIVSPEISYYPFDNAEIVLGTLIIGGKDTTTFGKVKDNDELYLKVKYSF